MNAPLYPTPDEIRGQGQKVSIRDIQRATCRYFGIPMVDLLSHSKFPCHVEPRHVAMYLARNVARRPWLFIAREFKRDHSTIIHAVRKIEAQLDAGSSSTRESLAAIKAAIGKEI